MGGNNTYVCSLDGLGVILDGSVVRGDVLHDGLASCHWVQGSSHAGAPSSAVHIQLNANTTGYSCIADQIQNLLEAACLRARQCKCCAEIDTLELTVWPKVTSPAMSTSTPPVEVTPEPETEMDPNWGAPLASCKEADERTLPCALQRTCHKLQQMSTHLLLQDASDASGTFSNFPLICSQSIGSLHT